MDDIKPFGKKSIHLTLSTECHNNIDACLKKYQQLKETNYNNYFFEKPSELNRLGYSLLGAGQVSSAIKVFTLLVNEFPEGANGYDSLGEAYFNNNNYPQAIVNLKKALSLNPNNDNAKEMLLKMKVKTKKEVP
jgi:tetratricopeptide (TPR) repeat protein